MTIIDAHHHTWDLQRSPYAWLQAPMWDTIRKNQRYDDLRADLRACGVTHSIMVQADNTTADNDHMQAVAGDETMVAAYVGWVPLDDATRGPAEIERLADDPKFAGVRHVLTFEANDDWVIGPTVLQNLAELERRDLVFEVTCDRLAHPAHIPALARRFPRLHIVVNHIAKPPIGTRGWEPWASVLAQAAAFPNVCAKLSGLTTPYRPEWRGEDFQPYIDHALRLFGPERLMYASNWPVTLVAGSYGRHWEALAGCLATLSSAERAAIYGGTALRCYRLEL